METPESKKKKTMEEEAWDDDDGTTPWKDKTTSEKIKTVIVGVVKVILLLFCLYLFVCSLKLMTRALNLMAGRVAVDIFTSNVFLSNPITGLIIGVLVTVVIQSSSTSISIVVAMVAAGVISVEKSIPIVMGANIGTSVTNTGVALTLSADKETFRKAFAGATVHDCFNILSVTILLIIEVISGYLEAFSGAIIKSIGEFEGSGAPKILITLTYPIVGNIIHLNQTVQKKIAANETIEEGNSLIQIWCERQKTVLNGTNQTIFVGIRKCDSNDFLLANTGWSEKGIGGVMFAIVMLVLIGSLLGMVKILTSSLKGGLKTAIRKAVNTNFPDPFGWLSGYVAVFVGCGVTMVIQSSSVVTSTLTPLVGLGVVRLKRMFAVTVGANMGTTLTAVLAALATGNAKSLQLSFCHMLFNITGFVLWYPLPFMRKIPILAATGLGDTTAKYRWFSVFYIITVFFVTPLVILGLSFAPVWLLSTVIVLVLVIVLTIIVINVLQTKRPNWLPLKLRNWDFLPLWMHSLKPMDRLVTRVFGRCKCCKCCREPETDSSPSALTYENTGFEKDVSKV